MTSVECERGGLVTRLAPDEAVDDVALELACRIARHSGAALRLAKRALRGLGAGARHEALRQAGEVYLQELMETEDAVEGLRAFTEKRQPAWSDA